MRRVLLLLALAVGPARAADPDVTIALGNRQANAVPTRVGFTHTGGGNITVQQPSPDTLVVTMAGVAVAGAHPCKDSAAVLTFDLVQELDVAIAKADVKAARITMEARLVGLLRSHCCGGGSASISCPAQATLSPCGDGPALLHVELPGRAVAGGENLSINDQHGPVKLDAPAGRFVLHQKFAVQASHPKCLLPCKTASAEFAPDPALDPLWISAWEPFKGAKKADFGFQVTIKVSAAPAENKAGEKR
jgi:hypothetical protein